MRCCVSIGKKKGTCHRNGLLDISEKNNDKLVMKGHFLNIHDSGVAETSDGP